MSDYTFVFELNDPLLTQISMQIKSGYKVATREPLACGLCYNKQMNSNSYYCDEHYNYTYPCTAQSK